MLAVASIVMAYALGSVPVAHLASRWLAGVDLRERGSGNIGASNVWQSAPRWLTVPVGLLQIGQGLAAVLVAVALDQGDAVRAACGLAAVIANDWNPWLRLEGGRGIGATIGVLLALAPVALGAFIAIAVAGVALRAVPQGVALALLSTPVAAAVAGEPAATSVACGALAGIALAKRLLANEFPDASAPSDVWRNRLLLDRDVRDREAWVRRRRDGVGVGD
jgi:glycerol-3-phosphate acyltransferase PlsY